jgi:hypothetical protein
MVKGQKEVIGLDCHQSIATAQAAVAENCLQSMRQLSRHHSMDPTDMRNWVKKNLHMESHVIIQRPPLNPNEKGEVPKTPQQAEGLLV